MKSTTLLLAMIVFLTTANELQAEGGKSESRFLGTWRLVTTEATYRNGTKGPHPTLGPHGKAYLIYTPDHHMCAVLMNPGRPNWNSSSAATEPEAKSAVDGFYAYCGTFEVHEEEHYVVHNLEVALTPNDVGEHWRRSFRFSGDRLILRPMESNGDDIVDVTLTWERVH